MDVLFFLFGFPVFCIGVYLILDHIRFVSHGLRTTGEVIGYRKSKGSKGTYYYSPIIRAYVGTKSEFTSGFGSGSPSYPIGKKVEVLYIDGKKPRINSMGYYMVGIFLMIFGGIFALIYISNFRADWWSISTSVVVTVSIGFTLWKKMKEKGYDSLKEVREEFNKAKDNEEGIRIFDPMKINLDYRKSQRTGRSGGWVLSVIATGLLAGSIYLGIDRYEFIQRGLPGAGQVIDFRESYSDGSYTYFPVIDYSPDGSFDVYTFEHEVGSNPPSYRLGDRVEVLYNPDDPEDAIIDRGIFNYMLAGILGGIGFVLGSIGISLLARYYKNRKLIES